MLTSAGSNSPLGPPVASSMATYGARTGFPHTYALTSRRVPPSIGETEAFFGPEANSQTSGVSNLNTLILLPDAPSKVSVSPSRFFQSLPFATPYQHSYQYANSLDTLQSSAGSPTVSFSTPGQRPTINPSPTPGSTLNAISSASRSQAPPASVSPITSAAEKRPLPSTSLPAVTQTAESQLPKLSRPGSGNQQRKRVHDCWMCHKSFDRPSTLRKVSKETELYILCPLCVMPCPFFQLLCRGTLRSIGSFLLSFIRLLS